MTMAILVGGLITMLGASGSAMGILATKRATMVSKLMPLSPGLLLGMAVFLIFPEALNSARWSTILGFSLVGYVFFVFVEHCLGRVRSEHQESLRSSGGLMAWLPLLIALSVRNALDGWNAGLACQHANQKLVWSFLAGMGLHKCTAGAAAGAIFRSVIPSTIRSLSAAVAVEAVTLVGLLLALSLSSVLGDQWTVWLLAATGGSFLYLATHAMRQARKRASAITTYRYAALGLAGVWVVSLGWR